jgi:hypothetical protein
MRGPCCRSSSFDRQKLLLSPHHRGSPSTVFTHVVPGLVAPSVPSSSGKSLNRGAPTRREGTRPSVPSSSGNLLNDDVRPVLAAHREAFCPLIIGEFPNVHGREQRQQVHASVPSSSGKPLNAGQRVHLPRSVRTSVPSSSGKPLNLDIADPAIRWALKDMEGQWQYTVLLSPHHRGSPSTTEPSAKTHSGTGVLSPHHRGSPSTRRRRRQAVLAAIRSVPSSSGKSLNSTPETTKLGADFQGWFETRAFCESKNGRSAGGSRELGIA